jgi:hypothetical protein
MPPPISITMGVNAVVLNNFHRFDTVALRRSIRPASIPCLNGGKHRRNGLAGAYARSWQNRHARAVLHDPLTYEIAELAKRYSRTLIVGVGIVIGPWDRGR